MLIWRASTCSQQQSFWVCKAERSQLKRDPQLHCPSLHLHQRGCASAVVMLATADIVAILVISLTLQFVGLSPICFALSRFAMFCSACVIVMSIGRLVSRWNHDFAVAAAAEEW